MFMREIYYLKIPKRKENVFENISVITATFKGTCLQFNLLLFQKLLDLQQSMYTSYSNNKKYTPD